MNSRKFRQAFIHVGADKTGSTSIQMTLAELSPRLLDAKAVAFPPREWHAVLGSSFCSNSEDFVLNAENGDVHFDDIPNRDAQVVRLMAEWIDQAPPCEALVFSFEGYVGLDAVAFQRFRAYCEQYAQRVVVVLYVRPPLSYAVSAMSQRVKQGRLAWSSSEPPVAYYQDYLAAIESAFDRSEIHVRLFSRHTLRNGDVVEDFLHLLGVPDEMLTSLRAGTSLANESLSWQALQLGEWIIDILARQGATLSESLFYEEFGRRLSAIGGGKIRLTPQQVEAVLAATAAHTDYLERWYEIRFEEDAATFQSSPSEEEMSVMRSVRAYGEILERLCTGSSLQRRDFAASSVAVIDAGLVGPTTIEAGQIAALDINYSVARDFRDLEIEVQILDEAGRQAFSFNSTAAKRPLQNVYRGTHKLRCHLVAEFPNGSYAVACSI